MGPTKSGIQPTGGNVILVHDFKIDGSHISITVAAANGTRPATIWELDAADGKLTGSQVRGDQKIPLTGTAAPALDRPAPKAWSKPEALFNGKDLTGWEPFGDVAHNNWTVKDGILVNSAHGANLSTTRKFDDFKVHFEVNCPDGGNSGFYLRGRYEVQIDYECRSARAQHGLNLRPHRARSHATANPRTVGDVSTLRSSVAR